MIDGRRVWLVSGRIPYARVPRETWAERIHAAKHLGLNTIETPVFWNRHEIRPGKFDFSGDNDLRNFVDLVGKAGMYCILGLGPYVGSGWDLGGLPAWLSGTPLRTNNPAFLESCSRFIGAVADQIKGWQVTAPGTGGPIVLVQCETHWTCGHDQVGEGYLGELTRYIRESGLNVPIVNSNNLWKSVEGQVDGWSASGPMLGTMRQLVAVRPGQPRMVIDLALGRPAVWGEDHADEQPPHRIVRRLAEVCAGGGQFNLTSLCAGTNFGFMGGRLGSAPDAFAATSDSQACLVDDGGRTGAAYRAVRRLAHAASRFGRVFSNLDPTFQPIGVEPAGGEGACSVIHASGAQGGVAFVFGDEPDAAKPRRRVLTLNLSDGTTLPVPVQSNGVTWCLFGVNVSARSRVDYTNLSTLGATGQALVLFGPPGASGMISVNGSPVEATVPDDGPPVLIEHEGLTLVVLNEAQVDSTFFVENAIVVGVAGVKTDGTPIPAPDSKAYLRIGADGVRRQVPVEGPAKKPRVSRPALSAWSDAPLDDYLAGTSPRFAAIAGPSDLTSLGCAYGYGWYRVTFESDRARRLHAIFPFAGDRLHLFSEGRSVGVVGLGPGAAPDAAIPVQKGEQSLVILAENFGRFCEGAQLGESKGLIGEAFEASPLRAPRPEIESGVPLEVLAFRTPLWDVSEGDMTSPDRVSWHLHHRRKTPVLMTISHPPESSLLVVNDKVIAFLDRSGPSRVLLQPDLLGKGPGRVQIAPLAHADSEQLRSDLAGSVRFDECVSPLFEDAKISFAKWEPAPAAAYGAARNHRHAADTPLWWKATLSGTSTEGAVYLHASGMTKGQIFVNGRHLCRYFVATASGKRVPPQDRYLIPASWLKSDGNNELVLFDEHGANPSHVRVTR
ncbi:beta-galactosidase [Phycisphaerales bacterium]|nr:beta-galactosidase [Phycisphaerales bacterium]